MECFGALRQSGSDTTVYFCPYNSEYFPWKGIANLLCDCEIRELSEENICFVAIEGKSLKALEKVVGMVLKIKDKYITLSDNNEIGLFIEELKGDFIYDQKRN